MQFGITTIFLRVSVTYFLRLLPCISRPLPFPSPAIPKQGDRIGMEHIQTVHKQQTVEVEAVEYEK